MTWNNVLELAQGPVSFGSHTYSHELLPRIPLEKAKQELNDSKRMVEAKLGKPCTLFAYPNGDFSPEVRALVADAGYKLAFINRPGAWLENTDPLLIPRVNLWEGSVVDRSQRFSSLAFRYVALWKAYRALS
jgi:peptidoglycan/xylan/chitin deacetylase (PgdA/CDA1 family)